jgi:hypothetical protein
METEKVPTPDEIIKQHGLDKRPNGPVGAEGPEPKLDNSPLYRVVSPEKAPTPDHVIKEEGLDK